MRIEENSSGFEVRDLPPGLQGIYGTDVVLPTGKTAYLQGASCDAHVHVQAELESLALAVPAHLSPQMLLRLATQQFCNRLNATSQNNA